MRRLNKWIINKYHHEQFHLEPEIILWHNLLWKLYNFKQQTFIAGSWGNVFEFFITKDK